MLAKPWLAYVSIRCFTAEDGDCWCVLCGLDDGRVPDQLLIEFDAQRVAASSDTDHNSSSDENGGCSDDDSMQLDPPTPTPVPPAQAAPTCETKRARSPAAGRHMC